MTQAKQVRSWAREQGYEMGIRGKIAPAIWEAYAKAHDDFTRDIPVGLWRCNCGRQWTGLAECHCTMCHRHFSTVSNFDHHRTPNGCLDPLTVENSYAMRIKDTMWGPIYVNSKEHYLTGDGAGLYDE